MGFGTRSSLHFRTGYFLIGSILLGLWQSSSSLARENLIPGSRYTSGRGAAMGDALLPLGDDVATGLFYNPATLGKIRSFQLEPVNFSLYGSSGFANSIDSNSIQFMNLGGYLPNLNRVPGQIAGTGASWVASLGFSGFALSLLAQQELSGQINSDRTVTYRTVYQLIPAIGTGFRLFDGVLRIGYSLQLVNEAVGVRTVAQSSSLGFNQGLAQGTGLSHNLGLALTIPISLLPALNVVVRNAFDTNYSAFTLFSMASSPTGVPTSDPMTVDASFSIQPRLGRGTILNLVVVDRDVFNRTGVAFLGHIALGLELSFRNRFFLRAGLNGGYPSGGLGIKGKNSEINLTYYKEEVGTQYLSQGDTRYMLQYQIRAF